MDLYVFLENSIFCKTFRAYDGFAHLVDYADINAVLCYRPWSIPSKKIPGSTDRCKDKMYKTLLCLLIPSDPWTSWAFSSEWKTLHVENFVTRCRQLSV